MKKILVILFLVFSIPVLGFAQQVEIRPSQGFFNSVERTDITTVSVNLVFNIPINLKTSVKILIETPSSNSDDVCVDWRGTTAVCPAANTFGDQRISPGTSLFIDNIAITNLSVIAASGTQVFKLTAWR